MTEALAEYALLHLDGRNLNALTSWYKQPLEERKAELGRFFAAYPRSGKEDAFFAKWKTPEPLAPFRRLGLSLWSSGYEKILATKSPLTKDDMEGVDSYSLLNDTAESLGCWIETEGLMSPTDAFAELLTSEDMAQYLRGVVRRLDNPLCLNDVGVKTIHPIKHLELVADSDLRPYMKRHINGMLGSGIVLQNMIVQEAPPSSDYFRFVFQEFPETKDVSRTSPVASEADVKGREAPLSLFYFTLLRLAEKIPESRNSKMLYEKIRTLLDEPQFMQHALAYLDVDEFHNISPTSPQMRFTVMQCPVDDVVARGDEANRMKRKILGKVVGTIVSHGQKLGKPEDVEPLVVKYREFMREAGATPA